MNRRSFIQRVGAAALGVLGAIYVPSMPWDSDAEFIESTAFEVEDIRRWINGGCNIPFFPNCTEEFFNSFD
jgi:hypothetical protein